LLRKYSGDITTTLTPIVTGSLATTIITIIGGLIIITATGSTIIIIATTITGADPVRPRISRYRTGPHCGPVFLRWRRYNQRNGL
jgi:hypothetical protein